MSIEKKSLISNRTATKKAIVAKPEVSKVAATKVHVKPSNVRVGSAKISMLQQK